MDDTASLNTERPDPAIVDSTDSQRWQLPDPRLRRVWLLLLHLSAGLCAVLLSAGNALAWRFDGPLALRVVLAALLSVVLIGWLLLRAYIVRAFAQQAWALADDGLLLRRGVWWQHQIFVPRARIQHTDVTVGPVARRYGLATLVVHTSGTRTQNLDVEGLTPPQALALRERLLQREPAVDSGRSPLAAAPSGTSDGSC